jgi:hypothetical protein
MIQEYHRQDETDMEIAHCQALNDSNDDTSIGHHKNAMNQEQDTLENLHR